MYKVVNAERTAEVGAASRIGAAMRFLSLPLQRLYTVDVTDKSAVFGVYTEDLHETDERVAVFEIEEGG